MKIAFFSEIRFASKVPRYHKNMRVEFAQMCALEAEPLSYVRYHKR